MSDLADALQALGHHVEPPDDSAPDDVWASWMDLMDVSSQLVGILSTVVAGGCTDRTVVRRCRDLLDRNPEWRSVEAAKFDASVRATHLLLTH